MWTKAYWQCRDVEECPSSCGISDGLVSYGCVELRVCFVYVNVNLMVQRVMVC